MSDPVRVIMLEAIVNTVNKEQLFPQVFSLHTYTFATNHLLTVMAAHAEYIHIFPAGAQSWR